MPERHSEGSSGSSSSSSSGGSSWSSSSGSSWRSSSYHNYGNDGPSSPEEQALGLAVLVIIVVVVAIIWIGDQVKKASDRQANTNATATTAAITAKDLAEMHAALDGRIVDWKRVADGVAHHVSPSDAGLDDGNTKEVVYGYCESTRFYVYVLELSRPGGYLSDTEGYAYTPDSYPYSCHPNGFTIDSDDNVGNGWHFVTLRTYLATSSAGATNTALPQGTATNGPIPTSTASKQ